jgi:hypothetical protein
LMEVHGSGRGSGFSGGGAGIGRQASSCESTARRNEITS